MQGTRAQPRPRRARHDDTTRGKPGLSAHAYAREHNYGESDIMESGVDECPRRGLKFLDAVICLHSCISGTEICLSFLSVVLFVVWSVTGLF